MTAHASTLRALSSASTTAPAQTSSSPSGSSRHSRAPFVFLSLGVFVLYAVFDVVRYAQRLGTWDTAVFAQAVQGYAHLGPPTVNLESPGMNQLGEHFSPALAVLAPLYRLFPSPLTIELAQVALIAASVYVLGRTAERHLSRRAGLALAAAYAVSFGVQSAVTVGFHENAFAPLVLAIVGSRFLDARYGSAALWSLCLLMVKEDLALVVAALGVAIALQGSWRLGAALVAGCAAYLGLVVGLVIPALNPRHQYDFLSLATTGADSSLLDRLIDLPVTLVSPSVKVTTVLLTFVVVGFFVFRSWFSLLALPVLLTRLVSPLSVYWTPYWHYSLPLMTILFIAAIETMRGWHGKSLVARSVRRSAVAAIVTINAFLIPFFPLQGMVHTGFWEKSDRATAFDRLAALIPDDATVQANSSISVFLVSRHTVYWLTPPDTIVEQTAYVGADYILVDQDEWEQYDRDGVQYARKVNPGIEYDVVGADEGYTLLRRTTS